MTARELTKCLGWRVYGLGVMAMGTVGLVWRDFILGQPVPGDFPARTAFAYAAGAFMVIAGAAVQWRRTSAMFAVAITAYYALIVVILMNGRLLFTNYARFGTYSGIAEQLSLAAGGLIVYANAKADIAGNDKARAARLVHLGQRAFGLCALLFGGAHFVYMNLTAPLVPRWLPPTQEFWGYATGLALVSAGASILTGVLARLAACLLTVMFMSFALLVHAPTLAADSSSPMNWTESAVNLALIGVAWVVADSLIQPHD